MTIQRGNWGGRTLTDMHGKHFKLGDRVVRAYTSGRSANLEIRTVSKIDGNKLFLNDSHVPINYPGRMLIITGLEELDQNESQQERRICPDCSGTGWAGGDGCCSCDGTGGC